MFEAIVILACIGALYQWRHTDFVKAILMVLSPIWGLMKVALAVLVVAIAITALKGLMAIG
jgi:hypothetical protein